MQAAIQGVNLLTVHASAGIECEYSIHASFLWHNFIMEGFESRVLNYKLRCIHFSQYAGIK